MIRAEAEILVRFAEMARVSQSEQVVILWPDSEYRHPGLDPAVAPASLPATREQPARRPVLLDSRLRGNDGENGRHNGPSEFAISDGQVHTTSGNHCITLFRSSAFSAFSAVNSSLPALTLVSCFLLTVQRSLAIL